MLLESLIKKFGVKSISIVYNSNLPKIIAAQSIHFAKNGRVEKFPEGPICSPKPGPTLLIAVAAPEIDVSKSNPKILRELAVTANARI